jgi:hypothetical protein
MTWTESRIVSDVQDPLGVELRVSTRMAGQLLFCITTITPRARYYSFLPWVIDEYRRSVKDTPADRGMRAWIRRYEKAFALGCIAASDEDNPLGRGVVGRRAAVAQWDADDSGSVELAGYRRQGSLAWNQYGTSLVNLHLFNEISPEEEDSEEEREVGREIDVLTLSDLGQRVADAYGSAVESVSLTKILTEPDPKLLQADAVAFANRAGADQCIADGTLDRQLLRDLFFNRVRNPGTSHELRRESLLLLMALTKRAAELDQALDWHLLGDAAVFGRTVSDEFETEWDVPSPLDRICRYWRMFYLHNHLSAGLEGILVGLVKMVQGNDSNQVRLETAVHSLFNQTIVEFFEERLEVRLNEPFGAMSFTDILKADDLDVADSQSWRSCTAAGPEGWLSEPWLSSLLREKGWALTPVEAGLAVSVLLVCMAAHRYGSMQDTDEGRWCARNISDPYLDLAPPLVLARLDSWDPDWRERPLADVSMFVFDRFVIRQHELLGYDKAAAADAMILHASDGVLTASGDYGGVTIGNPRLPNAIQILKDLGLINPDGVGLTQEGSSWLDEELQAMTV